MRAGPSIANGQAFGGDQAKAETVRAGVSERAGGGEREAVPEWWSLGLPGGL